MDDEVTVPDEYDDWPFDARRFVLAEANKASTLRREIDSIVGLDTEFWSESGNQPSTFTKEQLAALLIALGGPER